MMRIIAVALAAALSASPAARIDLPVHASFLAADPDRDGVVSIAEFKAIRLAGFDALDTDASGTLDDAEAPSLFLHETVWSPAGPPTHRRVSPLDADRDGHVARNDFQRGAATRFAAIDHDRSGFLSRTELDAARADVAQPHGPVGRTGMSSPPA